MMPRTDAQVLQGGDIIRRLRGKGVGSVFDICGELLLSVSNLAVVGMKMFGLGCDDHHGFNCITGVVSGLPRDIG
jgi:hypothetical protein